MLGDCEDPLGDCEAVIVAVARVEMGYSLFGCHSTRFFAERLFGPDNCTTLVFSDADTCKVINPSGGNDWSRAAFGYKGLPKTSTLELPHPAPACGEEILANREDILKHVCKCVPWVRPTIDALRVMFDMHLLPHTTHIRH